MAAKKQPAKPPASKAAAAPQSKTKTKEAETSSGKPNGALDAKAPQGARASGDKPVPGKAKAAPKQKAAKGAAPASKKQAPKAPPKYARWLTDDGILLLCAWARKGLTDQQLADNIGVSRSTLNEWKKRFPQIAEALANSKAEADMHVENALYKNAVGYVYEEEVAFKVRRIEYGKDGKKRVEKEELQSTTVKRWHPGETGAQAFWLKNRLPEDWKDKPVADEEDGIINLLSTTRRPEYAKRD